MLLDKEDEVEEEEGRRMSEYQRISHRSQSVCLKFMLNKVEVTSNMAVVLAVSGRGMPQIVQCESTQRGLHEHIFYWDQV